MAGNQSRGLIAASKTRGWDPTVIPAKGRYPAVDLSKIDYDPYPNNISQQTPVYTEQAGGYPAGWPDGTQPVPPPGDPMRTGPQDIFSQPLFSPPDTSKETVSRGVGRELPIRRFTGPMCEPIPQPPTPNTSANPTPAAAVDFSQPKHDKAGVGRTTNANPFAGMGGQ